MKTNWIAACVYMMLLCGAVSGAKKPNVLLLTVDDMNWDSLGVTGCSISGISPNIDRLAKQGVRFHHAHVASTICGPSRNAMLTGRYPHCSGSMGHGQMPPPDWRPPEVVTPRLDTYLHENGYYTGAILKHSRQLSPTFDIRFHEKPFGVGFEDRNPDSFYERTKLVIENAKGSDKPFFLYANPIDPHDPWPRTEREAGMLKQWNPDKPYPQAATQYDPAKVDVPAYLPDAPETREYIAPYYDSVHRGDACVGAVLRALKDSGVAENTLVVFLSDHGMWPPGAKRSLYDSSTRTPLIISWPGKIPEGVVNTEHMVSSVDIMPTIIEAAGLPEVNGLEGRSLWPILQGQAPAVWRDYVYAANTYFGACTPEAYYPGRALIGKKFTYIFNIHAMREPERENGFDTYHEFMKVLKKIGERDPAVAARFEHVSHRPAEEFYDTGKDPGCWKNLSTNPEHKQRIARYRNRLEREMRETGDPESKAFEQ